MVYTSGTSSRPKGVVHAQRSRSAASRCIATGRGSAPTTSCSTPAPSTGATRSGSACSIPGPSARPPSSITAPKDIAVWPKLIRTVSATLFAAVPLALPADPQILRPVACRSSRPFAIASPPARRCSPTILEAWRAATGKDIYEALRHERVLDLRLQPRRPADQAGQPRQAAARHGGSPSLPVDGPGRAAAGGRGRAARHPPQRPWPDARLLAPPRRGGCRLRAATGSSAAISPPSTPTAMSGITAAPTTS